MIPGRSFMLAFVLGAAADPAYAQEIANVSLPAVQDGRFVATFSPWGKQDGTGLHERLTISGYAAVIRGQPAGRPRSRIMYLYTCQTTKDAPTGLILTGADSAGTEPNPSLQISDNNLGTMRLPARSGWLRLESVSATGIEAGSARFVWTKPYGSIPGLYSLPQGGTRQVVIEVRFRAKPRTAATDGQDSCGELAAKAASPPPKVAQPPAAASAPQAPTVAVSLPSVEKGRFIATAAPWTKDDGSGLVARATFSGPAVALTDLRYGTGGITLMRCDDAPDTPKSLSLGMRRAFAVGTHPVGVSIGWSTLLGWGMSQRTAWLRIDSVSAEAVVGIAKITWLNPYALTGNPYATPEGKSRPVEIEARFRAVLRNANDRTPVCPPGNAGVPAAAQANVAPTNVKAPAPTASAAKSNFQPTDGFKPTPITPAYPFGLQSLEKTIANDPPALQQAVRGAYSAAQNDYWYSQYYDAGCVAHAFREALKINPKTSPRPGAVPVPRCIDRAKIIKMYADRINGPHAAVVTGADWVATLWPNASAEKRALFANCIGERIADIIVVNTVNGTPAPQRLPVTKFAEACKGALQ
jgi:hypothetical protein